MDYLVIKSPEYFILTYISSTENQLSNAYKNISENFNLSAERDQNGLDAHFKGLSLIIVCTFGFWNCTNFLGFVLKRP